MKSLNDNYVSSHGSTHETFTDLMFLALVVLVLFVLTLAIEVSQRVKADLVAKKVEPVPEVTVENLEVMSAEEIAELSRSLQAKQKEIEQLQEQLAEAVGQIRSQEQQVQNQLAALNGEQRFTGAREPASLVMAYDLESEKYYFISSRDFEHADQQISGESFDEYYERKTTEFVRIAIRTRTRRGFTAEEAKAIYAAFSRYKEVEVDGDSYKVVESTLGISFHRLLCGFIAGIALTSEQQDQLITRKLLEVYQQDSPPGEEMYPQVKLEVDPEAKTVTINEVVLSPEDLKDILLSVTGRGVMLDLEGLNGPAPEWLRERVLIPAGYISKIPKAPSGN